MYAFYGTAGESLFFGTPRVDPLLVTLINPLASHIIENCSIYLQQLFHYVVSIKCDKKEYVAAT